MSPRARKQASVQSSALVPIDQKPALPDAFREKFAAMRRQQAASTPGPMGMPTIRAGNGVFTFPGAPDAVESFRAVALVGLRRNSFWEGKYRAGDEGPPVCMAIAAPGQHENTMAPMDGSPKKQSITCVTCAQNVAPQKACRNGIDLALLHEDHARDPKAAKTATITRLRISSTGIAPFGRTCDHIIRDCEMPLFGALLEFRQEQAEGASYFTTLAVPVAWLPPASIEALSERVQEAADELTRAAQPVPLAEGAEGSAPAALPMRRKKVAKKGARKL